MDKKVERKLLVVVFGEGKLQVEQIESLVEITTEIIPVQEDTIGLRAV